MKSPFGFDAARRGARVWLRVVVLAVLALSGDVVCRWRMRRSPTQTRTVLQFLQALSLRLVRALGLVVVREGEPPPGGRLFVANHRSYVDIPLMLAHVPAVFLAKSEIADWPLFGRLARRATTVFVVREDAESRRRSLVELAERLDAGLTLTVFPEGTTSHGPGLQAFRAGSFRLAAERGLGVVPVAIAYRDRRDAWVGDDEFLRHFLERFAEPRMEVTIAFGPTLYGEDGVELAARAERWISDRLVAMDRVPFAETALEDGERRPRSLVAVTA
jgi:1-acyl-sn-glycerol-3-phosphate acyltransferase